MPLGSKDFRTTSYVSSETHDLVWSETDLHGFDSFVCFVRRLDRDPLDFMAGHMSVMNDHHDPFGQWIRVQIFNIR